MVTIRIDERGAVFFTVPVPDDAKERPYDVLLGTWDGQTGRIWPGPSVSEIVFPAKNERLAVAKFEEFFSYLAEEANTLNQIVPEPERAILEASP